MAPPILLTFNCHGSALIAVTRETIHFEKQRNIFVFIDQHLHRVAGYLLTASVLNIVNVVGGNRDG
jgi:hypothetical protein